MMDAYSSVIPLSTIGKALSYSLQRWDKLSRYTEDVRLQIDNNLVENAIRPVAIGRKNYLFAGSHDGAHRAAMLYSFMGTCKINNVNPFEWLRDILTRIPNHPVNKLEELLPNNWIISAFLIYLFLATFLPINC
jgi:transposase